LPEKTSLINLTKGYPIDSFHGRKYEKDTTVKLSNKIKKSAIKIELKSDNKVDVLNELVGILCKAYNLDQSKTINDNKNIISEMDETKVIKDSKLLRRSLIVLGFTINTDFPLCLYL
jgi:hypothetical protein